MNEYDEWKKDPTPENMGKVLASLSPVINSEIQRFQGPTPILRSKARGMAVQAVRSFNPDSGSKLPSWVVTQMQPLARYNQSIKPIRAPEVANRQASELYRLSNELAADTGHIPTDEELADHIGLSKARVHKLRNMVRASVSEGGMAAVDADAGTGGAPAVDIPSQVPFAVEAVYDSLDPRDRAILNWKTGARGQPELSNMEIARRLGVSPAYVSQRSQAIAEQIQQIVHRRGV